MSIETTGVFLLMRLGLNVIIAVRRARHGCFGLFFSVFGSIAALLAMATYGNWDI